MSLVVLVCESLYRYAPVCIWRCEVFVWRFICAKFVVVVVVVVVCLFFVCLLFCFLFVSLLFVSLGCWLLLLLLLLFYFVFCFVYLFYFFGVCNAGSVALSMARLAREQRAIL